MKSPGTPKVKRPGRAWSSILNLHIRAYKVGDLMQFKFSYKIAGDMRISPHFRVREFHSKKDPEDVVIVDEALLRLLENIRNYTGKPVNINSGYRSKAYNATIKNASPKSQHCEGKAADIWIDGFSPSKVAEIAECYLGNSGGIGIYSTFTHVDVRAGRSRWKGAY